MRERLAAGALEALDLDGDDADFVAWFGAWCVDNLTQSIETIVGACERVAIELEAPPPW